MSSEALPGGEGEIAPGPPGHWLLGHLREFRRDVLGLLLDASRRHGDIVRFRLGPHLIHLLNHPDMVEQVLQKRAQNYDKATRSARFIRWVCGESLLTSNGASWQSQRRLLQPFFHGHGVRQFHAVMVERTQRLLGDWESVSGSARSLDVASEMMRLTYSIAVKAFFDADSGVESDTIDRAMQVIMPFTFGRLKQVIIPPRWIPTRANREFREALASIDSVVYRLIDRHRSAPPEGRLDLLGMLLAARHPQTGAALSPREIRDQTITFLLAGHETTSNALTWTWYLLAKYPEIQAEVRAEVRDVLKGAAPSLDHLSQLPSVRNVLRESMRLYPPIWIIERRVISDDRVGKVRIPAGSAVVVCPYTLHRHPGYWQEPDEFRPSRFAADAPPAYIPFGAGPRHCIGSEFALLEAQLITALIVQRFQFRLVPGSSVEPEPGITLRVRGGLPLFVTPVATERSPDQGLLSP